MTIKHVAGKEHQYICAYKKTAIKDVRNATAMQLFRLKYFKL